MAERFYETKEEAPEEIAVIGLSGRFPGARNIEQFWQNIKNGVESIISFTDQELKGHGVPDEILHSENFVKAGTILEGVGEFDAGFFGCSPREALTIDPQQRIFMETAWEALENAGYSPQSYDEPIGVYAGSGPNKYQRLLPAITDETDLAGNMEYFIGNTIDFLSTRISYKFNLRGPSMTVQTGCSTSLVAVHLACQSLLDYQCSLALAGGASINPMQGRGYFFQEGSIKSPDGHCRAFDADARGTVFGSGVGVVVLKRMSEALSDGDHIYAIIKSCAVNNDGALKIGYTAPSVEGQAEVVAMAHTLSDIRADTISYIEAHGTGTKLGDPIEVASLTKAFRVTTDRKKFCAIGSVKTNIGHTDIAAGIAGFIKTVLMLKHGQIPPSLNFVAPNPEIDFENSPFYVATELSEWQTNGYPRRAGVSSFGLGGTNAHAILEEAPELDQAGSSRSHQLLILSAKSASAVETATRNLSSFFWNHPDVNFPNAAYTLKIGREEFNYRRMIVSRDVSETLSIIEDSDPGKMRSSVCTIQNPPVAFMFPGQGAQYIHMASELYQSEPVFKENFDNCSEILQSHLAHDLRDLVYPEGEYTADSEHQLQQTCIAQPALFTTEYALAQLWISWGVQPKAMVGHSIGEYVAACLAGVFSLEDALEIVATRGRLMNAMPKGAMSAVAISETELQPLLENQLSLAAVNAPKLCVVSGEHKAIFEFEKGLSQRKIDFRRLHTSHAFHSNMMDPILEEFTASAMKIRLNAPQIAVLSNITGTWMTAEDATDPGYWSNQLRQTVRFSDCIQELLKDPDCLLLEVGPGKNLSTLAKQQLTNHKKRIMLSSVRHPKEGRSDIEFVLTTLGRLWLSGVMVDWDGFYCNERRHRIPLPTYPFERQCFWPQPQKKFENSQLLPGAPTMTVGVYNTETQEIQSTLPLTNINQAFENSYVAPRNKIEKALVEIWQKVLGIRDISVHDDYFDLGGSSLLAARIFAEIDKMFHKKIPLATLLAAPTVEKLAKIIADENWEASWSPLVALQSEGSKQPFFCVHAAGGNVLMYRDLAHHLGPDQPFYGLQSSGLDGKQSFDSKIEEMASRYIKEIQEVQKEGPYLLGGYCMGGTIALEMAQQLIAQNKEVGLLALFETYNWSKLPPKTFLDTIYYYFQKINFHWKNLLIAENRITFLHEKIKVANSRKTVWYEMIKSKFNNNSNQNNNGQKKTFYDLWTNNDRAAVNYKAKLYPGTITHFRPIKQYARLDSPEVSWEDLSTGGFEVHKLPVYPAGMMVKPFVRILAGELKKCIENVEITRGAKG